MDSLRRFRYRIAAALVALLGLLPASDSFAQPGLAPIQLAPKQLADRYRAVIDANDLTDDEKKVLLAALEKCAGEQFFMSKLQKGEATDILKGSLNVDEGANPWWIDIVAGHAVPRDPHEMDKLKGKAAKYLPSECLATHLGS